MYSWQLEGGLERGGRGGKAIRRLNHPGIHALRCVGGVVCMYVVDRWCMIIAGLPLSTICGVISDG